jgi:geranylgeranyl reductase family protein
MSIDVLVVGGGPAGALAARECALAGLRTTLVDARAFPREKVCGDALIPDSQAVLAEVGLLEVVRAAAHPCTALTVIAPGGREVRLEVPFLDIRRERFDALLVEAASKAGVEVVVGKVEAPLRDAAGAVAGAVCEGGSKLPARLTILATGAAAGPLAAFGVQTRAWPSAFAMRNYVKAPNLPPDALVIDFERAVVPGYGWVFPMGNGEANLGVGVFVDTDKPKQNLRQLYDRFITECPAVREVLAGATPLTEPKGAPLRCGLEGAQTHAAGLLLAGEAMGTTYSLSGEGIGKSMESGRIAARVAIAALAQDRTDAATLAGIDTALATAGFPPKFEQYRKAQRFMRSPVVVDLLAWRAKGSQPLRRTLEGIVGETVAPTEVMSLRGLLRAVVG